MASLPVKIEYLSFNYLFIRGNTYNFPSGGEALDSVVEMVPEHRFYLDMLQLDFADCLQLWN